MKKISEEAEKSKKDIETKDKDIEEKGKTIVQVMISRGHILLIYDDLLETLFCLQKTVKFI